MRSCENRDDNSPHPYNLLETIIRSYSYIYIIDVRSIIAIIHNVIHYTTKTIVKSTSTLNTGWRKRLE